MLVEATARGGSVRRMSDAALKTSPLHDRHVALGAKMADFGGWEMPIEYPGGGVVREHTAVRTSVGIFDASTLKPRMSMGTSPRNSTNSNSSSSNNLRRPRHILLRLTAVLGWLCLHSMLDRALRRVVRRRQRLCKVLNMDLRDE